MPVESLVHTTQFRDPPRKNQRSLPSYNVPDPVQIFPLTRLEYNVNGLTQPTTPTSPRTGPPARRRDVERVVGARALLCTRYNLLH